MWPAPPTGNRVNSVTALKRRFQGERGLRPSGVRLRATARLRFQMLFRQPSPTVNLSVPSSGHENPIYPFAFSCPASVSPFFPQPRRPVKGACIAFPAPSTSAVREVGTISRWTRPTAISSFLTQLRSKLSTSKNGKVVANDQRHAGSSRDRHRIQTRTGFISCGKANTMAVFDLKTPAQTSRVPTGEGPDAIMFDSASNRVFAVNGHGSSATVVDAETASVVGTMPLGGNPSLR